jgi:hypothetical protein
MKHCVNANRKACGASELSADMDRDYSSVATMVASLFGEGKTTQEPHNRAVEYSAGLQGRSQYHGCALHAKHSNSDHLD